MILQKRKVFLTWWVASFTLRQLYLRCLPNVQEERMAQNQYGNLDPATPYYQLPQWLPLLLHLLNCLTKQQRSTKCSNYRYCKDGVFHKTHKWLLIVINAWQDQPRLRHQGQPPPPKSYRTCIIKFVLLYNLRIRQIVVTNEQTKASSITTIVSGNIFTVQNTLHVSAFFSQSHHLIQVTANTGITF